MKNIEAALKAINKAAEMNPMIQGIHVEGPFISKDFKGAQPEEYIRPAQLDVLKKWQELSGNRIRFDHSCSEKLEISVTLKSTAKRTILFYQLGIQVLNMTN